MVAMTRFRPPGSPHPTPDNSGDPRWHPAARRRDHTERREGIGLLECARKLGWALNTVKRYARAANADELRRPPRYRQTLVDPYRDHLRRRLAGEPDVAVTRLLAEIRDLGYTPAVANLLVRYLNQGHADAERTPPSPRRLVSWLMTRPDCHRSHRTLAQGGL
jgi:hypothetical protein